MKEYQEVDFYLTEKGWIMGDIRNQDGEIIRPADNPIPSNYALKTMERTYKPTLKKQQGESTIKLDNSNSISIEEKIKKIDFLEQKYSGTKPYVPYIYK